MRCKATGRVRIHLPLVELQAAVSRSRGSALQLFDNRRRVECHRAPPLRPGSLTSGATAALQEAASRVMCRTRNEFGAGDDTRLVEVV